MPRWPTLEYSLIRGLRPPNSTAWPARCMGGTLIGMGGTPIGCDGMGRVLAFAATGEESVASAAVSRTPVTTATGARRACRKRWGTITIVNLYPGAGF